MLDLMLGNSSDAFSCGEVVAWYRPWRRHHFKLVCQCGQTSCPVWKRLAVVDAHEFHHAVLSESGVDFAVDSSKDLCWVLDSQKWAMSKGITTYNILIWKNPVNLAYSHWKRGKGLDHWHKEFIAYHERFLKLNLPFRAVNYNELVKNPQKILNNICNFVGMPYFEGKERFWENHQSHYLFGSDTTSRQTSSKQSEIWTKDDFLPKFQEHIQYLENKIAHDTKVQQILDELNKSDIRYQLESSGGEKISSTPKLYPLWYYGKKAKQIFKRHFPENYTGKT
ncbi:MAG: sulfotransferase [Nitrosomonas sp.]|nr:sulfotransferase [Nitrosomonas sp.]